MSIFTVLMIVAIVISTINDLATKRRQSQTTTGGRPRRAGAGTAGETTGGAAGTRRLEQGGGGQHAQHRSGQRQAEQSAQVLLPDDLWAILTGEQRSPAPLPVPDEYEAATDTGEDADWADEATNGTADDTGFEEQTPVYGDRSVRWQDEAGRQVEIAFGEDRPVRSRAPRSAEPRRFSREPVVRPEREVISLELDPREAGERRSAQRPEPGTPRSERETSRRAGRRARDSARIRGLRRAIILREVLGPPRGLENPY